MLTGLVLFAIIVLRGFPATPCARWLDRTLVAGLRRITRTHFIFLILMSVILIAGTELLAMAGPFDMALVVMWDVSAYIDIVLTTVVVASVARGGAGWRVIVSRIVPRRTERARRRRTARTARKPANDDERAGWHLPRSNTYASPAKAGVQLQTLLGQDTLPQTLFETDPAFAESTLGARITKG